MASAKPCAVASAALAPAASALAWPVDRMPVYSEGPMQAAICTNVVEIATPNGFISGGSVRRPAVCDGREHKARATHDQQCRHEHRRQRKRGRKARHQAKPDSDDRKTRRQQRPLAARIHDTAAQKRGARVRQHGNQHNHACHKRGQARAAFKVQRQQHAAAEAAHHATVVSTTDGQNARLFMGDRSISG